MGRRKIEIVPITHERNRSVTLQKRCRGLMKKAYELGVLCSVEIAVIVFEQREGHKPKLYEYCSTDIRSVVQKHLRFDGERDVKTPLDFGGTKAEEGGDDDDGDDDDAFSGGSSSGMRRGGMGMGNDNHMGLNPTQLQHLQPSFGGMLHPSGGFPSSGERSRSNTVPSYSHSLQHKRPRIEGPARTPYGFGLDLPSGHGGGGGGGLSSQSHHYGQSSSGQYSSGAPNAQNAFALTSAAGSPASASLRGAAFQPRTGQLHAASFEMDSGGGFDWPVHQGSSSAAAHHHQQPQQQQPHQQQQQQQQQPHQHRPRTPSLDSPPLPALLIRGPPPPSARDSASWLDFFGGASAASAAAAAPDGGALPLPMPSIGGGGGRRPSLGMGPSYEGVSTPRMGSGLGEARALGVGAGAAASGGGNGNGNGNGNGHGLGHARVGSPRIKRENMDDSPIAVA